MERAVMLVKVTADRGQEKWYKKDQIHLVFVCPQSCDGGPGHQVVGYSACILIKDCQYLNEDPFNYVRGLDPEVSELIEEYLIKTVKNEKI